jgi:dihydroorotate dehydrogenase (NAD+) catalytic subunit
MELKPDLSVNIGRLKLKNPIITASGTFGYADEFENFVNLQKLGSVITKGITLKPKEGNPQPRIREVKGGLINWIGLENIGINAFIEQKLPVLRQKNIDFIVNIAGSSLEDYVEIARICGINGIEAVEMNVSCPNVTEGCLEFGKDPDMLKRLTSAVREAFNGTLIVKLSPNVSNPAKIAQIAESSGADAISAINTLKGMSIKTSIKNGQILYDKVKGGLSGSCIKPVALSFIHDIKAAVKIPIIGMGGITSFEDVIDFIAVGSSAIQVGTANFTHPNISEKLVDELEQFMKKNNIISFEKLLENTHGNNTFN